MSDDTIETQGVVPQSMIDDPPTSEELAAEKEIMVECLAIKAGEPTANGNVYPEDVVAKATVPEKALHQDKLPDASMGAAVDKLAETGIKVDLEALPSVNPEKHTVLHEDIPEYDKLLQKVGDTVDATDFPLPAGDEDKFVCDNVIHERAILTPRGRMVASLRVQRKRLDNGKKGRKFATLMIHLPSRPPMYINPRLALQLSKLLTGLAEAGAELEAQMEKEDSERREKDRQDWAAGLEGKSKGLNVKRTGKTEKTKAKGKTSAQRKAERSAKDRELRNSMRKGGGK